VTAGLTGLCSGVSGAMRGRDVASVMQERQGPHEHQAGHHWDEHRSHVLGDQRGDREPDSGQTPGRHDTWQFPRIGRSVPLLPLRYCLRWAARSQGQRRGRGSFPQGNHKAVDRSVGDVKQSFCWVSGALCEVVWLLAAARSPLEAGLWERFCVGQAGVPMDRYLPEKRIVILVGQAGIRWHDASQSPPNWERLPDRSARRLGRALIRRMNQVRPLSG